MNRDMPVPLGDCPEDGRLVAYLDGALDGARDDAPDRTAGGTGTGSRSEAGPRIEALEVRAHLERCEVCRARLAAIRARSELVRDWLHRHDPPPPPVQAYDLGARSKGGGGSKGGAGSRGGAGRRWAVAAAILILAGVVAAPGIAWVAQRLQSPAGEDPPARFEAPTEPDVPHSTSFVPASAELEVSFRAADTRGGLILERAADSRVTLEVPDAGIGLTVSGDRVEIDNRAAPEGTYRLLAPTGLTTVRITVPGVGSRVVRVEAEGALPQSFELGGPPPDP